uniref:No apical meristem-associated C-terminal domain-containing protein n=1 Tax=Kalanchoe fedtschenkoi TaxID=63787 RepID=A0A7N1A1E9_KALFE
DQEHVIVAENEVPPVITQEKSSRSVKWSAKEEEMLISSWLTVSNDFVIGNAQTRGSFWGRVTNYFNMYRKTKIEREEPQIKSHYYFLMPQVNEFNCYYNQIVSDHHSGWSDNQIIEAARLNWKNAHKNKEFPYMHIWEMVKDKPKWAAQIEAQNASKKAKTSESGAYTSSSNCDPEEHSYGGNESESRPIGQKAAKRKLKEKGKRKKNVTESVNVDFEHRWKRLEELQAQKLAVLNKIKNKAKDDTLRADYEILMKDTAAMNDQQLAIHNHMCSIIKARHGIP